MSIEKRQPSSLTATADKGPSYQTGQNYLPVSREIIDAVDNARRQRKNDLLHAFAGIEELVINTCKPDKVAAVLEIINNLVKPDRNFPIERVKSLNFTENEAEFPRAEQVALWKVKMIRSVHYRELLEWIDLKREVKPEEVEELLKGILYVGMDVNSYLMVNDELTQQHKLRRNGNQEELTEPEYLEVREKLRQAFCFPKNGRVRIVWDLSTAISNHHIHTFSDVVELIAKPLDPELLDIYLNDAIKTGLVLRLNLFIAALEAFTESNSIMTIAVLSQELEKQGYSFKDLREAPTPELIQAIMLSVVSNMPIYRP